MANTPNTNNNSYLGLNIKIVTTAKDLQKQIDALVKNLTPIPIQIEFDKSSVIKAVSDLKKQIESSLSSIKISQISVNAQPSSVVSKPSKVKAKTSSTISSTPTEEYIRPSASSSMGWRETSVKTILDAEGESVKTITVLYDELGRQLTETTILADGLTTGVLNENAGIAELEKNLLNLNTTMQSSNMSSDKMNNINLKGRAIIDDSTTSYATKLDLMKKLTDATKQDISYQSKANTLYSNINQRIKGLKETGNLDSKSAKKFADELERINKLTSEQERYRGFVQLNQNISDARKNMLSLGQMFGTAFKKFAIWMGVTNIFYQLVRGVKDAILQVKNLDKALVELNKVADLTNEQLKTVTAQSFDLAQKVARTGEEVILAVGKFKKAGYTLQESFDLAEVSLRMTNVADGIDNIEEASSSLISILKGFNLAVKDATSVLDLLNHISNNFAVDVDDLTSSMEVVSASLAQTNTTIEETVALLTAGTEVIRDANKVATGINTISQRLRKMTEEGEDNADVIAKIENAFQKYTKGMVSMYEASGEVKSTYDVLADLRGVWDGLSGEVQAYLTELVAGNRNNKIMTAIFQNWETVTNSLTESLYANGSALEEEQKYLDSIEGKTNNLKSAWQELATTFIKSDLVKGIIDIATWFTKLNSTGAGVLSTLMGILSFVMLIKGQKIITGITNIITSIQSMKFSIKGLNGELTEEEYRAIRARLATTRLQVSLALISAVLGAVISAIETEKREMEEAIQATYDANEAQKEQRNNLQSLIDKYVDLAGTINKTSSTYQQLEQVQQAIIDQFGSQVSGTESVNNVLDEQIAKLTELLALQKEQIATKDIPATKAAYTAALEELASMATNTGVIGFGWDVFDTRRQAFVEELRKLGENMPDKEFDKLDEYLLYYSAQTGGVGRGAAMVSTPEEAQNYIDALELTRQALQNLYNDENISSSAKKQYGKMIAKVTAQIDKYQEAIDKVNKALEYLNELESQLGVMANTEALASLKVMISTLNNLPQWSDDGKDQIHYLQEVKNAYNDFVDSLPESDKNKYAGILESIFAPIENVEEELANTDLLTNALQSKLDVLKEIQSTQETELENQEKLLAVEKAREELAKAKSKRIRVYEAGKWKYISDVDEMETAQANLDKAIQDANLDELSQAISGINTLMDLYSSATGDTLKALREYFVGDGNLSAWLGSTWADKLAIIDNIVKQATGVAGFTSSYFGGLGTTTSFGDNLSNYSGTLKDGLSGSYSLNGTSVSGVGSNKNTTINIGNIELPNVLDVDSFITEITKIGLNQNVSSNKFFAK